MKPKQYFAILDENNIVKNIVAYTEKIMYGYDDSTGIVIKMGNTTPESTIEYDASSTLKKYGYGITESDAEIGYTYNEVLNAFIPAKPDPTYILNTEVYEWEPDQTLLYDLNNDGKMYKWIGNCWFPVESD